MKLWYLITWHESDGNDCTVYDTLVEASSEDEALTLLGTALEAKLTENGTDFSEDGNQLGYTYDCAEDCAEFCDGHGGTSLRTVERHNSELAARSAMSFYHSEWSI